MIDRDILVRMGIGPAQAAQFADPLKAACALYDISTPARVAAFVAQASLESARFTRLSENLTYTTPERLRAVFGRRVAGRESDLVRNPEGLANVVYANRIGNGGELSGDGWRFRGRGLFQLTGRGNYTRAAVELNRPYVADPDLVAQPSDACLTAAWYWRSIKGNALIDRGEFDATTRAINGPAMLHAAERSQLFAQALQAFA
jgi:putative chitinase